jgi:hypothetical protein
MGSQSLGYSRRREGHASRYVTEAQNADGTTGHSVICIIRLLSEPVRTTAHVHYNTTTLAHLLVRSDPHCLLKEPRNVSQFLQESYN